MKWEDQSILGEERFDNLLTKSQILDAQGKKDEAAKTKAKAMDMASGIQLHSFGRGLQFQKKQDEAFVIFQINVKKRPNEWYTNGELARMASAHGHFSTAVKDMKLVLTSAPAQAKRITTTGLAQRPQRADARRNYEKLLAAALEAFTEEGSAASLEDIARRAGVGIGTLYGHFPTRQALLEAVYVD